MRSVRAAWLLIAPLFLGGCLSDGESSAAPASASVPVESSAPPAVEPPAITETSTGVAVQAVSRAPRLLISEAKVKGRMDPPEPLFEGALELTNVGGAALRLADYTVRTDGVDWRLPEVELPPGQLYVARKLDALTASSTSFLSDAVELVSVLSDDRVVDELEVPASLGDGVLTRHANGSSYVYPQKHASVGEVNADLGVVRRLAAGTEFAPRDSGTNAIVTYDGYHWILGGWSNFGEDDWHSYTDVWKSKDGIRWELVNAEPPYSHYSSFVVWKDRMWVIGGASYSSTDGIDWRPEAITSSGLNQSVVLGDKLFNIAGETVQVTEDGEHWTVLNYSAPWTYERVQPMVVVYDDKIWVMGGVDYYGEPRETYYNDVWTSSDGVTWNLVNSYAAWSPRLWASAAVYDGKLFVIDGMNTTDWPDDFGNSAEIWFTEDGIDWFPLESELRWGSRHASLTTVDEEHGVLLIAGYGHGGTERIYNDVWSFRVSVFFSKPEGDLRDLTTWGKHKDGSGEAPLSFDEPGQLFFLRNRMSFSIDQSWQVTGEGSRIVVGDGQSPHLIELRIRNWFTPQQPLYLLANSTTIVDGCSPTVYVRHPQAALIDQSQPCGDRLQERDQRRTP